MTGQLRPDPVIVVGMHHSGTGILAQVLHENGVFMHANMAHYESRFFSIEVSDRFVMGGGGSWARSPVMPVDEVLAKLDVVRALIERKAYRRYVEDGYDGESRWGFKDPRACILLPLYLRLFSDARVVHIVRDGDAVAESLARSEKSGVGLVTDRSFWKDLWQQHVDRAREFGARHHHYHELRYDELCARPVETVQPLFAHLDLPFTDEAAAYVRKRVRPLAGRSVANR